jgi:hypothetical protein
MGDEGRPDTHSRSGARGLAAGMAATDDDDVEGVRSGNHAATSIAELENPEAGSLGGSLFHVKQGPGGPKMFHVKQVIKVNSK